MGFERASMVVYATANERRRQSNHGCFKSSTTHVRHGKNLLRFCFKS